MTNQCVIAGCHPGQWEVIDMSKNLQGRKCISCGRITVTAIIPFPDQTPGPQEQQRIRQEEFERLEKLNRKLNGQ